MATDALADATPVLERPGRPRSGRVTTVVGIFFSFGFFLGGLLLIGFASSMSGYEFWAFLAGILSASLAFYIPLGLLSWVDGA